MGEREIKVQIDGNVIRELSANIPKYTMGLNELLKNAYDAGAKNVQVNINTGYT